MPGVAEPILSVLKCLSCRGPLREKQEGLVCERCKSLYPLVDGVVRFTEQQSYAGSFGFQWHLYATTQLDNGNSHRSERAFHQRLGLTPAELKGKLVLDVGCGMGRFAEVATRWGAQVVGVDLSLAVEVAARNLKERDFTGLQADVFNLPFAPESFDCIYSVGVLHHTPDCERAFKSLPALLKPGGLIAVWLYSAYGNWYRMSDLYRKVTPKMPPQLLHSLCKVAAPLYHVYHGIRKIPVIGRPVSGVIPAVFPFSLDPDPRFRVLDTFDWYAPRYQSKHTYEEVFRWFESCGLEEMRVLHQPISMRGRKPVKKSSLAAVSSAEVA